MAYPSQNDLKTKRSVYRTNERSSGENPSKPSNLSAGRNQRRNFIENNSLSGSRTRSSSRTTSGNSDSSRSQSPSLSDERNKQNLDSNKPIPRKKRFLQRWDDRSTNNTRELNKEASDPENKDDELPYVYQQPEFLRITQDIIRKCDAEDVLVGFFEQLDQGESFDLSTIKDQQLKKKLRHLSKALYLERNDSKFKKPPECKISLFEVFTELLPFIKSKISSQPAYHRKPSVSDKSSEKEERDDDSERKLTKEEASELLSLREMHEQGFFVDYENIQKEFIKKQKTVELWGKTPEEQKKLLSSSDEPEEQPWLVFDREKEFLGASKSSSNDYKNLLNSANNFKESFKVVSKSTSFL